ncbi:MAG: alpha/beta-hydrolase family protein, partial [Acidimicrobiia bacterium]|nr:alpha/beta-hydrolase family protein [Acidimicrobiia bacterium]
LYIGGRWGRTGIARLANAALWTGAATGAYNAVVASIGRANEKVEPAYATPPESPLMSGSAESLSNFSELGQQGRRYVTDVVSPEMIEDVLGEPAVAHPIRTYVGFNSIPLYGSGRAELALDELERTGAFDRSYLLLVSPTGTGWVDQTVVEAAEFLARGDIATCSVQYGRFPSFLAVQKVGLGRVQFRLLLWGIRQRLRGRPPQDRPKVLVFGESLGAWTSSDVVMSQGITGFDHYGVDRALWLGLPALAKWSRNGMATGSNELVPDGTVGVFDRHEQLAALTDEERDRLRAVVLSHDNDPIAALRPEVMIREPVWLGAERGRNVPDDMHWGPVNTFWQVMVDAANAMVTVPGNFGSFGHDYRGDTARFVRDAFHLPGTTDAQTACLEEALVALDLERRERLKMKWGDDVEAETSGRFAQERFSSGVPLDIGRTSGPRWFK